MQFCKYIAIPLFFLFSNPFSSCAQVYQELGIVTGPVFLRSDYGERNDFQTNIENSGVGIGVAHFLNFAYSRYRNNDTKTFIREHFKLKMDFSYSRAELQHYGKWVDKPGNSIGTRQLKAMRGETQILSLGIGFEYNLRNIHVFEATDGSFNPFIGLGAQYNYYSPKTYSLLGSMDDSAVVFPKYIGGFTNKSGGAFSISGSLGTRYKLSVMSDLIVELKTQYYFSDWVDGLNPNPNNYKENKANDWNVWFNIGYIMYLENPL